MRHTAGTRERVVMAVIGAGAMADALVRGWTEDGRRPAGPTVRVTNRSDHARRRALADRYGVHAARDKAEALEGADVAVLAVKPADVDEALAQCRPHLGPSTLLLSLAAGVTTCRLRDGAGEGVPIVRAMPNTASAVGESMTAACGSGGLAPAARALAEQVLAAVGEVVWVPEEAMDAITGLSGSGPAYVFLMAEALIEAGETAGLPPPLARHLAVQTLFGAAKTMRDTGHDARLLRDRVTSPGGTTAAAMAVLERRGFRPALVEAVGRAAERSRELGGTGG
jgi:pyrroline-5-carboxylate reductase